MVDSASYMNLSFNSAFGVFDLFGTFELPLLGHVFLTLPSNRQLKSAQKSLKNPKILIKG